MNSPRVPLALATTLAALTSLVLTASPALAKEFHTFKSSFGKGGSGNGELALVAPSLSEPKSAGSDLAVNTEAGDVYVADTGNARVQVFSSSGSFIRTFATADPTFIAVDNSTGASKGDVYVADSTTNTVSKFQSNGTLITSWGTVGQLSGFAGIAGIAVDSSGNLWIYDQTGQMREYAPDASPITEWNSGFGVTPIGIAVDSSGNLYVARGEPAIAKLSTTGATIAESVDPGPATGLALDPSGDDLYVDHGAEVVHYGSTGEHLESFGLPDSGAGAGLALGSSHTVYLADTTNQRIDIFTLSPGVDLTVAKQGTGSGEVTSSPSGIACGSTCTEEFANGGKVILTATRATHSKFTGWEGCPNVISTNEFDPSECEVPDLTAASEVKAAFEPIPQAELKVELEGSGELTSSPSGIACTEGDAGTCAAQFDTEGPEATVTLFASAAADNHFKEWTGCEEPSETECKVTISAARSVKAVFAPTFQTLPIAKSGPGEVTSSPAGIDCGEDQCSHEFQEGSTVTLTASPGAHNHVTWGPGSARPNLAPTTNNAKSKSAPPKPLCKPNSPSISTPSPSPPAAPARSAPPAARSPTARSSAAPARAATPRPPPSPSSPRPSPTTTWNGKLASAPKNRAPPNAKSKSAPLTKHSPSPSPPTPRPSQSSPPAPGSSAPTAARSPTAPRPAAPARATTSKPPPSP